MVYVIQVCWHIPLLCEQWKTPDDGERNCPKHVEFHSKSKFEKLVHLVGFIVRNWVYRLLRKEVLPGCVPLCCVPLTSDCSVETLIRDMNRFSIDKKNLPWWSPSGDGQTATTTCSACLQTRRTSLHGLTSEAMVFKDFCIHLCCLAQTSCWWLRILAHLKPSGTTATKENCPCACRKWRCGSTDS